MSITTMNRTPVARRIVSANNSTSALFLFPSRASTTRGVFATMRAIVIAFSDKSACVRFASLMPIKMPVTDKDKNTTVQTNRVIAVCKRMYRLVNLMDNPSIYKNRTLMHHERPTLYLCFLRRMTQAPDFVPHRSEIDSEF